MKKALLVTLGFMFCIAAPAFAQSYLGRQMQDLQPNTYQAKVQVSHGRCIGQL